MGAESRPKGCPVPARFFLEAVPLIDWVLMDDPATADGIREDIKAALAQLCILEGNGS